MRPLPLLAAAVLLGSLYFAARTHARREVTLPVGRFVTADPAARARQGTDAKELGVALSGYEDLVKAHPDDLAALRGRIRTEIMIGAVGLGQPKMPDRVRTQAEAYLAHRPAIDPDGSFLQETLRMWVEGRLRVDWYHQMGFYACASTAIYTGARGGEQGKETLLDITRQGAFYLEFFPFARRYHPSWPIVEPLVTLYIDKKDDLAARVQAGVTLLEYHDLFEVGGDLVERHLPGIKDSIREMLDQVRSFTDLGASDAGRAAVVGTAILASDGDEASMRILAAAKGEKEIAFYAPHADAMRIARLWVGLEDFATMSPLTLRYKDLDIMDQEVYHLAAAHRAKHLLGKGDTAGEAAHLLDLIESSFESPLHQLRVFAMQALLRLAPERGAALVRRALDARGPFAVYAAALADKLDDPAGTLLPYLGSPMPEVGALAAATMLDLPVPHALQR
jgi:hypothetical protein